MKRDVIEITGKEVRTTGQDVWMSAAEIAELFNVTAAAVNNAIRGILKTDTLNDYEVCRCVRVNDRVSVDVYSVELIIPIAYRFDTYYTNLFRKWLVQAATRKPKEQQAIIVHLRNDFYC